jgi:signal transduction histidine kinase
MQRWGEPADRLPGLLDALTAIGAEHELDDVLLLIVNRARELVGAEDGLIELRDAAGAVEEVVREGGADGRPATRASTSAELAQTLRVEGETVGTLVLADKAGGGAFTNDDAALLAGLAGVAAVAVRLARTLREARLHERWVEALRECAVALLSDVAAVDELAVVTSCGAGIVDCELTWLCTLDEPAGELEVVAADGADARSLLGARVPLRSSLAGRVLETRAPYITRDARSEPGHVPGMARGRTGPVLLVPVGTDSVVHGVLGVARRAGSPAFTDADTQLVASYATQAAFVLRMRAERAELDRMRLVAERERIARELHDTVLQRVFAAGMSLQAASQITRDERVRERLAEVIDVLDTTIQEVRSTVFGSGTEVQPAGDR